MKMGIKSVLLYEGDVLEKHRRSQCKLGVSFWK